MWDINNLETFIQTSLNSCQCGDCLISNAFRWSDTDEGDVYWKSLHHQWYKINSRIDLETVII